MSAPARPDGLAGSYDPARTTGGGLDGELARLETQAALSFADELRVLAELGLPRRGVLLELGAGPGAVTRRLRTALPGLTVLAMDIDEALLAHNTADGAARVVGDAVRLPLRDGSVDAVLLRYVLQHLPDVKPALAEAARVLRPGGRIVTIEVDNGCWGMAEPVYPELGPIHAKVAAAQRGAGGDRTIGRRLTRMLRAAGFDEVALRLFATSSDDHPMADFAPHLGPQRLEPLVAAGRLSLAELALAADRWRRFSNDPEAWVMLVGFVASGVVSPAGGPGDRHEQRPDTP
ncbi:class I SAM-dependent methyltransferase [Streptomyces sp. NPDC048416]|uniref:class I SAM-dependent methyltransferase n=1 Tax=Streptomyces sp. NPDC048416 TaxID=3365546 RepID=UPI0037146349